MKQLILIYVVTFFASPVFGINYFWCEKADDCVKAYGGCGRYFSVHRRYKELYEAKAHKGDRVSNCLAPTEIDKKYKFDGAPSCKKRKCLLVLPKNEAPEKDAKEPPLSS